MKNRIYQVLILQCDDSYRIIYETANHKKALDYFNSYHEKYLLKIRVIESKRKKHGYDDYDY